MNKIQLNDILLKLEELDKKLDYISIDIQSLKKSHFYFHNFYKIMEIVKLYEWKNIKINYNKIKKLITASNKDYINIITIFSNNSFHFLNKEKEKENIKLFIDKVCNKLDLIKFQFNDLKKNQKNTSRICSNLKKNNYIFKIYNFKPEYENFIKELDNIYYKLIELNKYNKELKKKFISICNGIDI